jgi:multicomponent Na+:H+ antiporter subunit E
MDVARRAFAREPRLRPGWVALPVDLPAGARAALGGELSLMPGTLAAGSDEHRLLVHLLDTEAGFDRGLPREVTEYASIVGRPRGGQG